METFRNSAGNKSVMFNGLEELHPVGAKLGRGSRATVKLMRHQQDGRLLALKTINLNESANFQSELEVLLTECHVHKMCRHPNIIK